MPNGRPKVWYVCLSVTTGEFFVVSPFCTKVGNGFGDGFGDGFGNGELERFFGSWLRSL